MFIENRVVGGETVIPIPLGMDIVIQYNDRGIIQKVYRGFDKSVNISNEILYTLTSNNIVPSSIRINGGTTWVYGILHTKVELPLVGSGKLPDVNYDVYLKSFLDTPSNFKFYSCNVESLAVVFGGGDLKSRTWMSSEKFDVLPAYLMPTNVTGDMFEHMVKNDSYVFNWPLIMGLYFYSNGVMTYQSTLLYQQKIKKVETNVRDNGDIEDILYPYDEGDALYISRVQTNRFGIGKKSIIVYTEDDPKNILYNYIKVSEPQTTIACPTCGALIDMPSHGAVHCSDENCPSLLYGRVERMLGVLNLPSISKDKYDKYTKKKDFRLIDVFEFTEFEDVLVEVNLDEAMRSVVPATVLPGKNAYKIFAAKCNYSIETLEYYISHTEKFWEDLDLDRNVFYKLYMWLQIKSHVQDLEDILHNAHIKIKASPVTEIPTVLQDALIYLTGEFDCGTREYVSELISQYGGMTTNDFTSEVTCVVIGDTPDNIYGPAIKSAKNNNIPIFTETQFFQRFDIRRVEV